MTDPMVRPEDEVRDVRSQLAQQRALASTFVVLLGFLLSGFAFLTSWLANSARTSIGTTIYTAPIILGVVAVMAVPIRRLGLPLHVFGLTTARWRESLRDGLLFSIPVVVALTAVKAHAVATLPGWSALPILDPTTTLTAHYGSASTALAHFIGFNALYVLVVVPLQEFIGRGVLLGMLEQLLVLPRPALWANVLSNVIFGACHLFLSLGVALATVVLGMVLTAVYLRTRNLLGVCVMHAMVGTWALSVVRIHPLLT